MTKKELQELREYQNNVYRKINELQMALSESDYCMRRIIKKYKMEENDD